MEELLKEVALSERRKQQIDSFIQTVTKLLQTVPHSPEVEVCSTLNCKKKRHSLANSHTETYNRIVYFYVFRPVTCHGCLAQLKSPSSWCPKRQRASSTWHLLLLWI